MMSMLSFAGSLFRSVLFTVTMLAGTCVMAAEIPNPIEETIQKGAPTVALTPLVTGLTAPTYGTAPRGVLPFRLFVSEQTGKIWNVSLFTGNRTLFLDVESRLVTLGISGPGSIDERGLIGFAFHPQYAQNGLLYTYTSEPAGPAADFTVAATEIDHHSVITEWQVPNPSDVSSTVDLASARVLMRIEQPQFSHLGGTLAFGPDGMLYISLGDGGSQDDQGDGHGQRGNGSDPGNVLGTFLRIDPTGNNSANGQYGIPGDNPFVLFAGVPSEIYAYGFRNPYRFSFDSASGLLLGGDVGENDIEEVNVVLPGRYYGWNRKEGTFFFDPNGDDPGFVTDEDPGDVPLGAVDPVAQYDHDDGLSVIGGFRYRGVQQPSLNGVYIFGDFTRTFSGDGRLFYLGAGATVREFNIQGQENIGYLLLGFARDAWGEIYVLGSTTGTPFGDTGVVLKITAPAAAAAAR